MSKLCPYRLTFPSPYFLVLETLKSAVKLAILAALFFYLRHPTHDVTLDAVVSGREAPPMSSRTPCLPLLAPF